MPYLIHEDTVERLRELRDSLTGLSQGNCPDIVEARVAAAGMVATLTRIIDDDVAPLEDEAEYGDDDWDDDLYPDEGKPIEPWDDQPPPDLAAPLELVGLLDAAWFLKRDGSRYKPSMGALYVAKSLIPGDKCSASVYARFFQDTVYGPRYLYIEEDREEDRCPLCVSRRSCICEKAWTMNGETLSLHPSAWLDKARRWRRHGLATIGEIQAERHPVQVCLCPWAECPVRAAAGFADWRAEFLVGL